jgi:DNA-binding GntR family transcriptional regulator
VAHAPWDRQRSREEHEAIVAAIAGGDPDGAADAVLAHRRRTIDRVLAAVRGPAAGEPG